MEASEWSISDVGRYEWDNKIMCSGDVELGISVATSECIPANTSYDSSDHCPTIECSPLKTDSRTCNICGKRCSTTGNLKTHLHIHSSEKRFTCPQCDYKCNQMVCLKNHIRSKHTKETPFACDQCDMKFSQLSNLKYHLRTHTGERPFMCTICETYFTQSSNLRIHIKSVHGITNQFMCGQMCSKSFSTSKALQKHREVCQSIIRW